MNVVDTVHISNFFLIGPLCEFIVAIWREAVACEHCK